MALLNDPRFVSDTGFAIRRRVVSDTENGRALRRSFSRKSDTSYLAGPIVEDQSLE
jgi:hypothetical protein